MSEIGFPLRFFVVAQITLNRFLWSIAVYSGYFVVQYLQFSKFRYLGNACKFQAAQNSIRDSSNLKAAYCCGIISAFQNLWENWKFPTTAGVICNNVRAHRDISQRGRIQNFQFPVCFDTQAVFYPFLNKIGYSKDQSCSAHLLSCFANNWENSETLIAAWDIDRKGINDIK